MADHEDRVLSKVRESIHSEKPPTLMKRATSALVAVAEQQRWLKALESEVLFMDDSARVSAVTLDDDDDAGAPRTPRTPAMQAYVGTPAQPGSVTPTSSAVAQGPKTLFVTARFAAVLVAATAWWVWRKHAAATAAAEAAAAAAAAQTKSSTVSVSVLGTIVLVLAALICAILFRGGGDDDDDDYGRGNSPAWARTGAAARASARPRMRRQNTEYYDN